MEFTLEELCIKLEWDKNKGIAIYNGDIPEPDYADEMLETHGHLKVLDFWVSGNVLIVKLEKPKEDVWDFED